MLEMNGENYRLERIRETAASQTSDDPDNTYPLSVPAILAAQFRLLTIAVPSGRRTGGP